MSGCTHGGLGLSPLVSGLVAEAGGSELICGAWLDQLIAVRLVAPLGKEALMPIMRAEQLVAVAFDGRVPAINWDSTRKRVSGRNDIDRIIVVMKDAIIIVDPDESGVSKLNTESNIDPLIYSVSVDLNEVEPEQSLFLSKSEVQSHTALASGLVSAYSIGAATRCFDIAISYIKQREQFGRLVGSFQAIKHRAANCAIDLLVTRSLVRESLANKTHMMLHEARIAADECYRSVAESALQMHGGIGFTTEVPIHLFLKNAQRLRAWPLSVEDSYELVRLQLALDINNDRQSA